MTIPTRDELIERATAFGIEDVSHLSWLDVRDKMADFALSEIRRAVAEELEALRHRFGHPTLHSSYERAAIVAVLDARLAALREHDDEEWACRSVQRSDAAGGACVSLDEYAALRERESGYYETAGPGSGSVKVREDAAAPALSDADVLERAASLMALHGDPHMQARNAHVIAVEEVARKLRAASAPKPVDVFEAFERDAIRRVSFARTWSEVARDWFGPLVDVVRSAAIWEDDLEDLRRIAACALEALRQRAQEASR